MKSVFKKQIGGCGTYLEFDMELTLLPGDTTPTGSSHEIKLTFDDKVHTYFRDGSENVREVVNRNYDQIKEKCGIIKEIKVTHAESTICDFSREAYIGASIIWLNENLQLHLPMPVYTRDKALRKFMVEGYSAPPPTKMDVVAN